MIGTHFHENNIGVSNTVCLLLFCLQYIYIFISTSVPIKVWSWTEMISAVVYRFVLSAWPKTNRIAAATL